MALQEEYRDLLISTKRNGSLVFESTPSYLVSENAPDAASQWIPCNTKFIVSLRNPTARAWSQYSMYVRRTKEKETRTFEEMMSAELKDMNTKRRYLKRGLYIEQLKRWWCLFPRENFLIFCTEDYLADVPLTLNHISRFLNVSTANITIPTYEPDNTEKIPHHIKKMLDDFYKTANQELYEAMGSAWCKSHWT